MKNLAIKKRYLKKHAIQTYDDAHGAESHDRSYIKIIMLKTKRVYIRSINQSISVYWREMSKRTLGHKMGEINVNIASNNKTEYKFSKHDFKKH